MGAEEDGFGGGYIESLGGASGDVDGDGEEGEGGWAVDALGDDLGEVED